MRKAPPTSQGAQSPGRRIAGGKGMCARRAHHAPPARRCPSTIARFAMGFSGSNRRAGTIADGTARVPPPDRGPSETSRERWRPAMPTRRQVPRCRQAARIVGRSPGRTRRRPERTG